MFKLKLTGIGNSLGIVIPKEALNKIHLSQGDFVFLTESPHGYRITP